MIELRLPLPPSLNGYYENATRRVRHGRRAGATYTGRRISAKGQEFRLEVIRAVRAACPVAPRLSGRLSIIVLARPPDLRAFDLDNRFKCLLDALTVARVILDDALFDDIQMLRWAPVKHGAIHLRIDRFDPREAENVARSFGAGPEGLLSAVGL